MFYIEPLSRYSSVVLNSYVYLFIASIFTLPYIFYILLYSKTSNVVATISKIIQSYIYDMEKPIISMAMSNSTEVIEEYQKDMDTQSNFDNSLNDLNTFMSEIQNRLVLVENSQVDFSLLVP